MVPVLGDRPGDFEVGPAVSEEHSWGLIDRDPKDDCLMGFEIWEASHHLPPDLIAALPPPAGHSP